MKSREELSLILYNNIVEVPYEGSDVDYEAIIEDIIAIQKEAFNEALALASEKVVIRICNIDGHEVPDGTIDKESILKLKIK